MQARLFRTDINGLRAVAVIAVVLFHFNPTWLPGGFAGVDVFFVISGFLMTSIIFRDLEQQQFNLFKFYVARANRIIPALGLVCLVLIIMGWFFLLPNEYEKLGKHVSASMWFGSNLSYLKEAGYFDTASHEKWLLHSWSLSVEWQFYMIYPIILMLLKRFFSFAALKKIVVFGFIASLAYSIYKTQSAPNAAYYLLSTRAWEMILGGLAFLYPLTLQDRQKKWLAITGLTLILASYVLIDSLTPWPGYLALFPVFGSYLIIVAQQHHSLLGNNLFLQRIGKWSYSIYLWHWPWVVFGLLFEIPHWWLYGLPLSVLCGYLSYRYIESYKFPAGQHWSEIWTLKPLWITILIAALGLSIEKTQGLKWHYSERILSVIDEAKNKNPYHCMQDEESQKQPIVECIIGNKDQIQAIVVGDSHADAITTAVSAVYDLKQNGILAMTRTSCPFVLNAKNNRTNDTCYQENFSKLKQIQKYPSTPVVITARWPVYLYGQSDPNRISKGDNRPVMYFGENQYMPEKQRLESFSHNLTQTVCAVTATSPVFITQPIPEMQRDIPKAMSRALARNKSTDLSVDLKIYHARNATIRRIIEQAAAQCGATVLDPAQTLCKEGRCIAEFKGRPLYYDSDHLSEYGNKLLTPMFKQALITTAQTPTVATQH